MKRSALWKSLLVTLLVGFLITACNQSPAPLAQSNQNAAQPRRVVPNPIPITPDIIFQYTGNAFQGTPYPIRARIRNARGCVNTTWEVDAPDTLDTLIGTAGCDQEVTFGTAGIREVRVSTINWRGQTVSATLKLEVHTYPSIASAGFYYRKFVSTGVGSCQDFLLPNNSGSHFSEKACPLDSLAYRYFASAIVDNPTDEPLTYDWEIYVQKPNFGKHVFFQQLNSSQLRFEIPIFPATSLSVEYCGVTLNVNAPDPTRSKSMTVWIGQCILDQSLLN
jgi:hypothetical protein